MLIDTGFTGYGSGFQPGDPHQARDANLIMAAAHDAGIQQIDYLLITHFHPDHDGGVVELAQQVPIRTFVDHGGFGPEGLKVARPDAIAAYDAYVPVRAKGKHLEPKPGDRLSLAGVEIVFVS